MSIQIQERVPLRDFTTFRIGGPARYFTTVKNAMDVQEALRWAQERTVPIFILGGGSNLLFSDTGFDGLVIKTHIDHLDMHGDEVTVGSSVALAELIQRTLAAGLTGLEFAAGIPGEVGGAIRGNAGTYGVSIGDVIAGVTVVDMTSMASRTYLTAECDFSYRHSVFKLRNDVIIEARLTLQHGDVEASRKLIDERIQTRHENHPLEPSAGCIFKNVELAKVDRTDLRNRGIELTQFEKYQKIPTGYLIEQLGLKGKRIGGAAISNRHANYIINTGSATFEDVITLVSLIKQQVRDSYGIQLEEEAHIVDANH